jgi:hypothetical protein
MNSKFQALKNKYPATVWFWKTFISPVVRFFMRASFKTIDTNKPYRPEFPRWLGRSLTGKNNKKFKTKIKRAKRMGIV